MNSKVTDKYLFCFGKSRWLEIYVKNNHVSYILHWNLKNPMIV